MEGEGFEPSKAEPSDLQSDPFGRSGTPPKTEPWILLYSTAVVNRLLILFIINLYYKKYYKTVILAQAGTHSDLISEIEKYWEMKWQIIKQVED